MWHHSIVIWLATGLIASAGCAADAGRAPTTRATGEVEHWYRLDIDGEPAGWMLNREIVRGDRLTTISRLHMNFRRADTAQTFEVDSRFVETLDGQPLSAWSRQTLGQKPIETTWKFLPHEVLVDIAHDGETQKQRVPLAPTGWLTPGQIQPQLQQLLARDVRHFTLSSLDPQLGLEVVETEWILDVEEEVLIDGALLSTRRFRQRQSFMPQLETVANVTAEGLTVRSTTPMMGFSMTSTLARRDEALKDTDGPELLARTFVYPDRPIATPRRTRQARYEIRRAQDAPSWPAGEGLLESLPSVGAQRVESISGRTEGAVHVLVNVGPISNTNDDPESGQAKRVDRAELEPYLRASTFVDHQAAGVRHLLTEALGTSTGSRDTSSKEQSLPEQAETLRSFVSSYLRDKNLDSILASAGEVAASRSGDCTEHSVLLIALLRATGIPARAVTGLVYVEAIAGKRDLFGYHMWTQAWIGDRWLDLDATLTVPFDAAHIAFGTTALNDDHTTLKDLARLAAFIGQAEIRVLEIH